jgi:5'-nucleotidase
MDEILLVNDDGISSPGLRSLVPLIASDCNLTVVAPSTQKSWIGKASSYHRYLKYRRIDIDSVRAYALDGTTADCVTSGIYHFCRRKPDFIISGINAGANVGDAYILSSGTVGGAFEGAIAGIPSLAIGVEFSPRTIKRIEFGSTDRDLRRFEFASRFTALLVRTLLSVSIPPSIKVFNLNFREDADENTSLEITCPARYDYGSFIVREKGELYHRGAAKDFSRVERGTDMAAIRDGKISLSLLGLLSVATYPQDFATTLLALIGKKE